MRAPYLRLVALFAVFGALAALAVAFGSEWWDGQVPCPLCLLERWPYRFVIALGLLAAVLPPRAARPVLILAALCLFADAAIAAVHVGVEFKWWPSPLPECAAPHITGKTIAERLAQMPARPSKACEDATYLIPGLPLSMAAMNMLYALGFGAVLGVLVRKGRAIP